MRAAMDPQTLQAELAHASSNEAWVAAISRYFETHDLAYGHGTDNAGDEAFWLLRHLQRFDEHAFEAPADASLAPAAASLAARRAQQRLPLAYVLGEAWFAGLAFKVDPRVLVPRSPIAELVEARFAPWCDIRPGDRILDIGTGSGCIAIAAAVYCPEGCVDATDVSPAALELAAENVARHAVGERVRLFQADLFPRVEVRYRVIVSNPPYVPSRALATLPAEYGWEPAAALDGGESGLDAVARILSRAADRLTPDGILVVEVGEGTQALLDTYPRLPATWVELERGGDGVFVITARELAQSWQATHTGGSSR